MVHTSKFFTAKRAPPPAPWAAIVYNSLAAPARAVFDTSSKVWIVADYTLDVFLVVDVLWHFLLRSIRKRTMAANPKEVACLYLHGEFLIDLISVVPIDVVYFSTPGAGFLCVTFCVPGGWNESRALDWRLVRANFNPTPCW